MSSVRWFDERLLPSVLRPAPGSTAVVAAWAAARPELNRIGERLTAQVEQAPDQQRQAPAEELRRSLLDLSVAIQTETEARTPEQAVAARLRVEVSREGVRRQAGFSGGTPTAPPGPR